MKRWGWFAWTLVLVILPCTAPARAQDFDCQKPVQQTSADIKGDISGHARTFLKLGGAELKGNVEKTTVDLFSKYPHADRVAIISSLLSTTCNLLKNSKSLSDTEKLNKWIEIFPVISTMLGSEQHSDPPVAGPSGCPKFTSSTKVQSEYHSTPTVTVEVLFLDAYPGCQITNVDHRVLKYSQFSELKIDIEPNRKRARVQFNLADRPQQGFAELQFTVYQKAF